MNELRLGVDSFISNGWCEKRIKNCRISMQNSYIVDHFGETDHEDNEDIYASNLVLFKAVYRFKPYLVPESEEKITTLDTMWREIKDVCQQARDVRVKFSRIVSKYTKNIKAYTKNLLKNQIQNQNRNPRDQP